MRILITSVGRRVKIVEYFKKSLKGKGEILAADCDLNAPGLYFADEYFQIPRIDENNYINILIDKCKEHKVDAVISLLDPELEVLALNKGKFDEIGVTLILSPLEMIEISFDKKLTADYLVELGLPSVPTFDNIEDYINYAEGNFNGIIKPKKGSASLGLNSFKTSEELEGMFDINKDMIIQPYYKDKEYGIDVYVDLLSGELVDVFIKEKLLMRSGETDKSVSRRNSEILNIVKSFIEQTNFRGPIDIDCFEYQGKYYISEINPRFGGGYPHAFESGCHFTDYVVKNLNQVKNEAFKGFKYDEGLIMMKYDNVKLIKE